MRERNAGPMDTRSQSINQPITHTHTHTQKYKPCTTQLAREDVVVGEEKHGLRIVWKRDGVHVLAMVLGNPLDIKLAQRMREDSVITAWQPDLKLLLSLTKTTKARFVRQGGRVE